MTIAAHDHHTVNVGDEAATLSAERCDKGFE
jgi:hypothetical protein